MILPIDLPGQFILHRGSMDDYRRLECFHYIRKRPAIMGAIWVVTYVPEGGSLVVPGDPSRRHRRGRNVLSVDPVAARVVGVGVLSWPTVCNGGRERVFGLVGWGHREKVRFANANLRTISRVIVHPQFRSLGLASALVRCLCDQCPTRYVEASARMGRAHPLFERAGMTRVDPADADRPIYYWLDKGGNATTEGTENTKDTEGEPNNPGISLCLPCPL